MALEERLRQLEIEQLGQEHRLLQVVRNVGTMLREKWSLRDPRSHAVIGAFVRYWILPRRIVLTLTFGLGGLIALQANALLREQNQKIELQNKLLAVEAYRDYSSTIANRLPAAVPLMDEIVSQAGSRGAHACTAKGDPSDKSRQNWSWRCVSPTREDRHLHCVSNELYERTAFFAKLLSQRRIVREEEVVTLHKSDSSVFGYLADRLSFVIGDSYTGSDSTIPKVSERPLSPERGILLAHLVARRVNLTGFSTRPDFSGAVLRGLELPKKPFMPQVNLSGADLRGHDLTRAELWRSNLSKADLRGVNLDHAIMCEVELVDVDFESIQSVDGALFRGDEEGLTPETIERLSSRGAVFNSDRCTNMLRETDECTQAYQDNY